MWSAIPDLRSARALLAVTAAAWLGAVVLIVAAFLPTYLTAYGDTDDAIRLVLVRELLSGHGWYHPEIHRLQYPIGAVMHWSRLVDGGIAALDRLLALGLPGPEAEAAARALWPLLWLPFAILAVCVMARRLAGSAGLLAAGVLAAVSLPAFEQFRIGRIDHHNVQITLCLITVGAAIMADRGWRIAALAGFASGLGLAIGTEAIFFHALVALAFALRLSTGRGAESVPARAYGLCLAASTTGAFLLQTPPSLWTVSVCDTIGPNLVGAVAVGGLGLAAAAFAPGPGLVRSLLVIAAGGCSAGLYALAHPTCLHGPMGDTPPLIRSYVEGMLEMRPFPQVWQSSHLAAAYLVGPVLAALALPALLAREGRGRRPEWLLMAALLYAALGLGLLHMRLLSYANWFAIPIVAAALASVAALWRRLFVPTALAAVLISPAPTAAAIAGMTGPAAPRPSADHSARSPASIPAHCSDHVAFDRLRRLPPGLALADPDLGALMLAETPHAVLAGPYHRLVPGLTETFRLFSEPLDAARRDLAARHVAYVVDCPDEADKVDHGLIGPHGLLGALDRRAPPAWLTPLSQPGERLQVYAVRP
jgi:asparagine N-glycosylation enzyme membrane subunit Stt3